jgi:hypothetical protein
MESIVEQLWTRQAGWLEATQRALDGAADREQKAKWMAWKQEQLNRAAEKGFAALDLLLPAVAQKLGGEKNGNTTNPFRLFMQSISESQGIAAFGPYQDGKVEGNVFTPAQFDLFVKLASAESPDAATVQSLVRASLSLSSKPRCRFSIPRNCCHCTAGWNRGL